MKTSDFRWFAAWTSPDYVAMGIPGSLGIGPREQWPGRPSPVVPTVVEEVLGKALFPKFQVSFTWAQDESKLSSTPDLWLRIDLHLLHYFFFYFPSSVVFHAGSHQGTLFVLELAMWTRLALNSQSSSSRYLLSTVIRGVCHHTWLFLFFFFFLILGWGNIKSPNKWRY